MKTFIFLLYLVPFSLFCQTKLIEHKSHSGTNANFYNAMKFNDLKYSNFGYITYDHLKMDSITADKDSLSKMNKNNWMEQDTIQWMKKKMTLPKSKKAKQKNRFPKKKKTKKNVKKPAFREPIQTKPKEDCDTDAVEIENVIATFNGLAILVIFLLSALFTYVSYFIQRKNAE